MDLEVIFNDGDAIGLFRSFYRNPNDGLFSGYDAAKLLIDAIARAGSTDKAKIQAALAATKDFPAITGATTLNETHDAVKSAVIIEMKDGKQIFKASVKP